MKVLMVHCTYLFKGGEDTVVSEEIQLLRNHQIDVELLSFSNEGSTALKILQLPFNFSSYRKTLKKLRSSKPDLVHVHNLHFGASPSVIWAIKKTGIPFVITLHNYRLICPSAILFHKGRAFLDSINKSFPWKAVKKGVYKGSRLLSFWMAFSMQLHHWLGTWRNCKNFIVLSRNAQSIFQNSKLKLRAEQITVKPNFTSPVNTAVHFRRDHFLFIGRLSEEKGIRLLLDVFSRSSLHLKIAGEGPLTGEVISCAGAHPNIQYLGSVTKENVRALLTECSALVFPSIWYEGMPLTIIEAFACGTPVIATKLGAMEDMIIPGYNGFLFEAGNEKELATNINKWYELDEVSKNNFSCNALKTYEDNYSPEKNIRMLLSIYRNAVGISFHSSMVSAALELCQS